MNVDIYVAETNMENTSISMCNAYHSVIRAKKAERKAYDICLENHTIGSDKDKQATDWQIFFKAKAYYKKALKHWCITTADFIKNKALMRDSDYDKFVAKGE